MNDMKITRLCNKLRQSNFQHQKWKNINLNIKFLIYESFHEKSSTMSINRFCSYLKPFWIHRSTIQNIIKFWDSLDNFLCMDEWRSKSRLSYKKRYLKRKRWEKLEKMSKQQIKYIWKLRKDNPNMGYKTFTNRLLIPSEFKKYSKLFWRKILSQRQFYNIINHLNIPKIITKRQKLWLLRKMKKEWKLNKYIKHMGYIYSSFKSLHHWQIDIKYLTDIPNYVALWLSNIYWYQITFRDFKSGFTLVFYWNNRDKTRVFMALKIFKMFLELIWIDTREVTLQIDWGAEFSNIKIDWSKWVLIKYIEQYFKWFKIINKKEENWHVEAFHLLIERDLFDTKQIFNLKRVIKNKTDKSKVIPTIAKYIQNFNRYWYSSYKPRYNTFWKKSPLQIIKDDLGWLIDINLLIKYFTAYDIDWMFNTNRTNEYLLLLKSAIHYNEEIVANQDKIITLNSNSYSFAYFSSKFSTSQIWVNWYKLFYIKYFL